eukprot:scaffold158625_cov21-Cyclotella_meneghiniana.AAC.1
MSTHLRLISSSRRNNQFSVHNHLSNCENANGARSRQQWLHFIRWHLYLIKEHKSKQQQQQQQQKRRQRRHSRRETRTPIIMSTCTIESRPPHPLVHSSFLSKL